MTMITDAVRLQAGEVLIKFSKSSGIPIFNSSSYISAIPLSFELYGGGAANLAILGHLKKERPDLILLIGARTGMYLGGRSGAIIPAEDCKLIHVDTDGAEIGRTLTVDVGVISDAAEFLVALNKEVGAGFSSSINTGWVREALSIKNFPSPYESQPEKQPSGLLHPYHAIKHIFSSIQPGSIVIIDGGEAGVWAGDLARLSGPSAIISATGYLGFLGNGFGYALGAAIAAPDRKIISIQGDGSAGFHLMELDTYKRFDLDITTIIVNNACWGMSRNGQDLIYGTKNPARLISSLSPDAKYEAVGLALGNEAVRLEEIADIKPAVERLQSQRGPNCINLIVDAKPTHPFTSNSVSVTEDPNMIVVPYYDNIVRPHYKA